MSWWQWLVGPRGPEPAASVEDATFGTLAWSEPEEAWLGEYAGYSLAFAYSRATYPDPALLDYARAFLGEGGAAFARSLAAARAGGQFTHPRWAEEIAALEVGTLGFSLDWRRQEVSCLIDLIGGEPDLWWRVDFRGGECLGMGFDT